MKVQPGKRSFISPLTDQDYNDWFLLVGKTATSLMRHLMAVALRCKNHGRLIIIRANNREGNLNIGVKIFSPSNAEI